MNIRKVNRPLNDARASTIWVVVEVKLCFSFLAALVKWICLVAATGDSQPRDKQVGPGLDEIAAAWLAKGRAVRAKVTLELDALTVVNCRVILIYRVASMIVPNGLLRRKYRLNAAGLER